MINGQKVWTTQAQDADYVFLLARTDPDAPKHKGISYLLVPMQQPGVEVRPIVQPDGSAEFNEVFFTDVRCPKDNVVGGRQQRLEGGDDHPRLRAGLVGHHLAPPLRRRSSTRSSRSPRPTAGIADPTIRQPSPASGAAVQIQRINGLRTLSDTLHGTKQAAALGPLNKMIWSRDPPRHARAGDGRPRHGRPDPHRLGGGADEYVPGYGVRRGRADYPVSTLQASFFFSRSETIWGGAAEIQRNIVGERVLGPAEGAGGLGLTGSPSGTDAH